MKIAILLAFLSILLLWPFPVFDPSPPELPGVRRKPSHTTQHGMVASAHPLASRAGVAIMQKGGNAVDAAVAAAFVLGVVEPHASGLGGGGFMLIYLSKNRRFIALDHRETAPLGTPPGGAATEGLRSVAVPGTPAGLVYAARKYGNLPLSEIVEPAAQIAENGFPVDSTLSRMMGRYAIKLSRSPAARTIFLKNGLPYRTGELLRQKDLAGTLRLIGRNGADAFYRGPLREAFLEEMKKAGSWISVKDLEGYSPSEKEPVTGRYRDYAIVSFPPPSSGLHVIQSLNIIEGWDIAGMGPGDASALHVISEALRRAFVDRARFLGDPAFVTIPVPFLISKEYALRLRRQMDTGKASRHLRRIDPGDINESDRTTHISVIDKEGNAVSHTQTIGNFFGSGIVVPGSGILLNNEMADFSSIPRRPNAPAPGKRCASSMSPTMVLKGEQPLLIIGGAGAMRIVSSVTQIIVNMIDHGMDVNQAIDAPRIHAQSLTVSLESRIPIETREELRAMGYRIETRRAYDLFFGGAQGIMVEPGTGRLRGAADPRRKGAVAGY